MENIEAVAGPSCVAGDLALDETTGNKPICPLLSDTPKLASVSSVVDSTECAGAARKRHRSPSPDFEDDILDQFLDSGSEYESDNSDGDDQGVSLRAVRALYSDTDECEDREEILNNYLQRKKKAMKALQTRLSIGHHFPFYPPVDESKSKPGKKPKYKKLRCVVCNCIPGKRDLTYICKVCNVPICLEECWLDYHTSDNFYTLLKF